MNPIALQFPTITDLLLQPKDRTQNNEISLQKATLTNTTKQPYSILRSAKGATRSGFCSIKVRTHNDSYSFPAKALLKQYPDGNK